MLKRLARGSVQHRRLVVLAWFVGVAPPCSGSASPSAGENNTDFSLPRHGEPAGSRPARSRQRRRGPVCHRPGGGDRPIDPRWCPQSEVQTLVDDLLADIAAEVPSGEIDSPYATDAYGLTSPDGTVAFAEVNLGEGNDNELTERIDAIKELRDQFEAPGVALRLR